MFNTIIGISTVNSSALFDADFIVCILMIAAGFIIMKKSRKKLMHAIGTVLFAAGFGLITWMLLWMAVPDIMAQIIYGVRI